MGACSTRWLVVIIPAAGYTACDHSGLVHSEWTYSRKLAIPFYERVERPVSGTTGKLSTGILLRCLLANADLCIRATRKQ